MKHLPPVPLLIPVAALCIGLMVAEGWLLQRSQREAAQALASLEQKKQERARLARQSPALSPDNEAAVSAELATADRLLTEWRSTLQGERTDRSPEPAPTRSIDAFFELTGFIGQLRAEAGEAQVGLRPDERFGFATHANEGPATEQIAAVHRQRLAIQQLVEMLLASRPQNLLTVRRERPGAGAVQDQRNRADDFFELDRALSVRQPGLIESDAFRLEFTGQTGTLRQFINDLNDSRQPFVVRSVEAEPLPADSSARVPALPTTPGAPVPLVKPAMSKFGVTLELARLATNPMPAR